MELVEAQRQGRRRSHIPYRDSRLTFLLQVTFAESCAISDRLPERRDKYVPSGVVKWEALDIRWRPCDRLPPYLF